VSERDSVIAVIRDRLTDARRELTQAAAEPCSTAENRLIDAHVASLDAIECVIDLLINDRRSK
jgi:hypothetical protein